LRSKLAKSLVIIAGFGVALLGLLAGALSFIPPLIGREEINLLSAIVGASLVAVGIGLGLPLAWQGLNSWRCRPSRSFRPWPAWALALAFIVAVSLGQTVLSLKLMPLLFFPPLHIMATALPSWIVLASIGRRLAGVRWREVIFQMASGAFLATSGTFILELALALLLSLIVFTAVALRPSGAAWLQELLINLQNPAWLKEPNNVLQLLLSPAVLVILASLILFIAPLVEEFLKSLGVVIMWAKRPSKAQAFLWGLAGGAGFAMVEGLFSGAMAIEGWSAVTLMRAGAAAVHCLGSGLMGLGWYYLLTFHRLWLFLGAYAASVSIHAFWNAASGGMVFILLNLTLASGQFNRTVGSMLILLLTGLLALYSLVAFMLIHYIGIRVTRPLN